MSSSKESMGKILTVALGICIVCSIFVSTAAVKLKPQQDLNKVLEKKINILIAAGLIKPGNKVDVDFLYKKIETNIIDIRTGSVVENFDVDSFDPRKAEKDPEKSTILTANQDMASIKSRSNYGFVYLLRDENESIQRIILPVHGKGLWSTMYGFLALDADTTTIKNFAFYEHGETPGLGGEVDNPRWKALWPGKRAYDPNWEPKIALIKGAVNPSNPNSIYQVDGLSGSTLTSRGVTNLIQFWLGESGYGPFLKKIRNAKEGEI